jgi:membrane protease YdiL (CAAX protease family)
MEIAADAPLTPSDDGKPGAAFRDVPWTPKDVLFGSFWLLAVLYIPSLVVVLALLPFYDQHSRPLLAALLVVAGVSSILMAGVAIRFSVLKYHAPFSQLGFRPLNLRVFGWGLLALGGVLVVNVAYAYAVRGFDLTFLKQEACDQVPKEVLDDRLLLWITAFYGVAVAPFAEELFFRSFTLSGISKRWGVWAGIIASGTMFGLLHVVGNPILYKSLIPLSAVGIIFGATYWRSGNIASTMTAHLLYNVIATAGLFQTTCK